MNDNIIITRLWQDVDFFQIEIECKTELIVVRGRVYTTYILIDDLYDKIGTFLSGNVNSICWQSGTKGDLTTPCLMLKFLHKDQLGHILIEIFMEIDDGGQPSTHNCCFYLNTEIGLLYQFRENLLNLKTPKLGISILLNNEDIK